MKETLLTGGWSVGATLLGLAVCVQVASAQTRPERNPFLSADIYGVTHINPAKQNSIPYKINLREKKVDLDALTPVWGGPVNNSTYASARPGFFWFVSTDRVALIDARGRQWRKVADIDREVADSLVTIQNLAPAKGEIEKGVEVLRDASKLSRLRYDTGPANYLEVLIADQQLLQRELQLAGTQGDQHRAIAHLYRALGGRWAPAEPPRRAEGEEPEK